MEKTLTEICTKANGALALLNHRCRSCGGLHASIYSLLFKQLVQSVNVAALNKNHTAEMQMSPLSWGATDSLKPL